MTGQVYTYDGLSAAIIDWANRTDTKFIDNVPLFIALTEQELFIKLSTLGNQQYVTGNFTANNGTLPKPANWGKTERFTYIDSNDKLVVLQTLTMSTLEVYNPDTANPSAIQPTYYSDYGYPYFLISPTPTVAFSFELVYSSKIYPLTINNQTNWYTQNAYDILFWGCLHKASIYINASDWAAFYAVLYQQGIDGYSDYDEARFSDSTVKVGKA